MDKEKLLVQFENFEANLKARVRALDMDIESLKARRSECSSALSEFQTFKDYVTKAMS